ncbi:MAG TPA: TMEM175 family protein [Gemmatimonadaceae bacterium]|nr:TMEM175 family protein [Gemmatimonadaceae bacterium]
MPHLPFRVRGRDVTRLEAFSDAVFGFAATLLVVSLEVPRDYSALMLSLRGFIPFAACFALLIWIWSIHNGFFRRYGMQDAITVVWNSVLLFVVLFFVYPMRVVMTSFIERVMWGMGLISGESFTFALGPSLDRIADLFAIYGAGFTAIFACFVVLYHRAITHAATLELDELERFDAVTRRGEMSLFAAVGALGTFVSVTGIGQNVAMGGWIYALLGPLAGWWGFKRGRLREKMSKHLTANAPTSPALTPAQT